jgi:hypothetical protein
MNLAASGTRSGQIQFECYPDLFSNLNQTMTNKWFVPFACLLVLVIGSFVSSCKNDTDTPGDTLNPGDTVCFTRAVLPIFQQNCGISGCHTQSAAASGYVFVDFQTITSRGVVAGRASESVVYQVLTRTVNRMPPAAPLSTANIQLIERWLNQGARNTTCQ